VKKRKIVEQEKLEKIILAELVHGAQSYTSLCKKTLSKCGTPATFWHIFSHLKQSGRIEKVSGERRAPYRLSEKGKQFLEALS
jgi:predicted transcriptional regulator